MKRYFRFIGGLLLTTALFSCNLSKIEEFQLGENFVDSNSGVALIDTMVVYTSTVRFDSIVTNGVSSLLVGGYKNVYTGTVNCNPYFQLTSGSFTLPDKKNLICDSLVVRMKYDGYFLGDTTKLMTINVKQVTEKLKLNSNTNYLYNTSSFQLADGSLCQKQFYPLPNSKNDFYLHLSDQLRDVLFKYITNRNDTVTNSDYFKTFFQGMALVSNENQNQATVGFAHDSTSLRVYYHQLVSETDSKTKTFFSFPIDATGIWFNQISYNPAGSLLGNISQSKNELPSTSTSDMTMIQAGDGIYTKINIPGAKNLKGYGKNVAFIGSTIQITPSKNSYSDSKSLPDSLAVYVADRKNQITSQLTNGTKIVYANKIIPAGFEEIPYYEIDVAPFFTSELAKTVNSESYLLIGTVASRSGTSVNPIIFSGTDALKQIVKMHVYCYIDRD